MKLLGLGDGFNNPEIKEGFLRFAMKKSRFYESKSKQNNPLELLSVSFKHIFYKNELSNATTFATYQKSIRSFQQNALNRRPPCITPPHLIKLIL